MILSAMLLLGTLPFWKYLDDLYLIHLVVEEISFALLLRSAQKIKILK